MLSLCCQANRRGGSNSCIQLHGAAFETAKGHGGMRFLQRADRFKGNARDQPTRAYLYGCVGFVNCIGSEGDEDCADDQRTTVHRMSAVSAILLEECIRWIYNGVHRMAYP